MKEDAMPEVTYYANVTPEHPASDPAGLFRVLNTEPRGSYHAYQALRRDLQWHQSDLLYRYFWRGSMDWNLVEISEEQAQAIIERWREEFAAN
jgi:hypothetical protein